MAVNNGWPVIGQNNAITNVTTESRIMHALGPALPRARVCLDFSVWCSDVGVLVQVLQLPSYFRLLITSAERRRPPEGAQ